MAKLKFINGVDVSDAIGFVYDGCHKIYLVYGKGDVAEARDCDYKEVYPMDYIYEFFREQETDDLEAAYEEFSADIPEAEIRLVRIKFISDMAN